MRLVAPILAWLLAAATAAAAAAAAAGGSADSNRTVSPELFWELEELSRLVAISYCVGNEGIYRPFKCLSHCDSFPDMELVETWNLGLIDSASCGYVGLSRASRRIVVAFRGSNSLSDTLYDLMTQPAEYAPLPDEAPACADCRVHSGFMALWESTRPLLLPTLEQLAAAHPGFELLLAGHSLGGAVAALAALELAARGRNVRVVTFGEPRLGNAALAAYIDGAFPEGSYTRVTHAGDPVPLLPFASLGFEMHSSEVHIAKDGLPVGLQDVRVCEGAADPRCIAGPRSAAVQAPLLAQRDGFGVPGLPAEWRLWEILFAHRQYFWRIGLCWDPQRLDYPRPPDRGDEL